MAKNDFDEFIKRQQTSTSIASLVDWDKQRDEWLDFLNTLYTQIEAFLQTYISAGEAQRRYEDIELIEEGIGSYIARKLVLTFGRQEVIFTPIGTLLIGTKGRVDVRGPAGEARLVLVNKKATSARSLVRVTVSIGGKPPPPPNEPTEPIEWGWKIVSRPPELKFLNLTKEAFFEMILEVCNA
jgi:hypothetical protein